MKESVWGLRKEPSLRLVRPVMRKGRTFGFWTALS